MNERERERGREWANSRTRDRQRERMEKRRTVNANASILVKIANSELIMEQPMGLEGELHPKIIENRGWVTWFRGKQKKKKEKNTTRGKWKHPGRISRMFNEQRLGRSRFSKSVLKLFRRLMERDQLSLGKERKSSYARIGTGPLELSKETST